MKLDEIVAVSIVGTEGAVNEMLDRGYRIFKVYSIKEATPEGIETVRPLFILGKAPGPEQKAKK